MVGADDFVLAALDPLEGMFVPAYAPTHVAQFAHLVRASVGFRDVAQLPFGESRRLV